MTKEVFIVGSVFTLPDGSIVVGFNTLDPETRDHWQAMSISDLEDKFRDTTVSIRGDAYALETKVLGVQVVSSIAEFKNVFVRIEQSAEALKVAEKDTLEIFRK